MADREASNKPRGFTLLRSVNGRIVQADAEIDQALEMGSSTASLAELQQRGYSRVRVVDREKVASLVKEAVSRQQYSRKDAGGRDAGGDYEGSEAESDENFGSLRINRENLGYLTSTGHASLADIVAEVVQARLESKQATVSRFSAIEQRMQELERLLRGSAGQAREPATGADDRSRAYRSYLPASVAAEEAAERMTSIDERMRQLEELLRRTEQTAEDLALRTGAGRDSGLRRETTEQQQALLEEIYKQNVQLQALTREAEAAAHAL